MRIAIAFLLGSLMVLPIVAVGFARTVAVPMASPTL